MANWRRMSSQIQPLLDGHSASGCSPYSLRDDHTVNPSIFYFGSREAWSCSSPASKGQPLLPRGGPYTPLRPTKARCPGTNWCVQTYHLAECTVSKPVSDKGRVPVGRRWRYGPHVVGLIVISAVGGQRDPVGRVDSGACGARATP